MPPPTRAARRARTWQHGHVRGCPLNPLDWLRTLYMQIAVRSFGISVAALVARAKPGDFLGMSGRGVFAAGQELFTNSRISHVGVVCVSRDVKCIAHATPHADHLPNHNVGGCAVRITPLEAFIEAYLDDSGLDVCLRPLRGAAADDRARINAAVLEVAAERGALPFTTAPNAFLSVRFPVWGAALALAVRASVALGWRAPGALVETAHRSVYCTEFLTRAYVRGGVFRDDAADTHFRYAPGDFGAAAAPARSSLDLGPGEGHLPFADARYSLGEEVYVY